LFSWTEESALEELDELLKGLSALPNERRHSSPHTRWLARSLAFLEEVFGKNSRYYRGIAGLTWSFAGSTVLYGAEGRDPEAAIDRRDQEAYLRQLDSAHGFLLAAADHLRRSGLQAVYQGKNTGPEASLILKVLSLADQKLRKVIRKQPEAEKEVQDAFETLLIGADIAYTREADSVVYSSKTYVPDFTVSRADLAIEIKLCARSGREKEIIAEINDDILAYRTRLGNVLFVVYDCGHIRDTDRFSGQLQGHDGVLVRVVKH
jgi:hypothetical protein